MTTLPQLVRVLGQWPNEDIPYINDSDSNVERLRQALVDIKDNIGKIGKLDISGLLRDCLRQHHPDTLIRVPYGDGWPDDDLWRSCGFEILPDESGRRVSAREYFPDWLQHNPNYPICSAAFQRASRRSKHQTHADPGIIDACGYQNYQSPGQREAVRAAFLMQPGDTLAINLPTGSGKTLAAFAPSLISNASSGGGITIVATPTIALALDLEQRISGQLAEMRGGIPLKLAYHSGLDSQEKDAFKQRIYEGSQPIIFASPESLLGALRLPILSAAKSGLVRYFVIDEAHLVASWGSSFRPEFQTLSGLRRSLVQEAPEDLKLRTLLMTGTLTQSALDVLRVLYTDPGELGIVSAAQQRCEPDLWIKQASGEEDKISHILELVHHVPRPFILYTTRPIDAQWWYCRLREIGLLRSGCIHGGTPPIHREESITKWRNKELDAIVL